MMYLVRVPTGRKGGRGRGEGDEGKERQIHTEGGAGREGGEMYQNRAGERRIEIQHNDRHNSLRRERHVSINRDQYREGGTSDKITMYFIYLNDHFCLLHDD